MAVKESQPALNEEVRQLFRGVPEELELGCHEETTKEHGRINGAGFFSVLRRLSLNIIKKDTSKKAGISRKRKMAARNSDYLTQLMRHFQAV